MAVAPVSSLKNFLIIGRNLMFEPRRPGLYKQCPAVSLSGPLKLNQMDALEPVKAPRRFRERMIVDSISADAPPRVRLVLIAAVKTNTSLSGWAAGRWFALGVGEPAPSASGEVHGRLGKCSAGRPERLSVSARAFGSGVGQHVLCLYNRIRQARVPVELSQAAKN